MQTGYTYHFMNDHLPYINVLQLAAQHAEEYHSVDISQELFDEKIGDASLVFMCLPTSEITFQRVKDMAPYLKDDAIIGD